MNNMQCGFQYIDFDPNKPNPYCKGDVAVYDVLNMGDIYGIEILTYCEYHRMWMDTIPRNVGLHLWPDEAD